MATVGRMLHGAQHGPVLVIDDDADVRALLEAVLENRDSRSKRRPTAQAAWPRLASTALA